MTSKRNIKNRLDRVDPEHETERIFVVSMGGEPEQGGWLTPEEYAEYKAERDADYTFEFEW